MGFTLVTLDYLQWHYTKALVEFSRIYKNLLRFVYHFFSVPLLLQSFFSPWRRLGEAYPKDKFDLEGVFTTLVVNSLMRLVGIFMRLVLIGTALVFLFLMILFYPVFLAVWLLLPFLSLAFIIVGAVLLIAVW